MPHAGSSDESRSVAVMERSSCWSVGHSPELCRFLLPQAHRQCLQLDERSKQELVVPWEAARYHSRLGRCAARNSAEAVRRALRVSASIRERCNLRVGSSGL